VECLRILDTILFPKLPVACEHEPFDVVRSAVTSSSPSNGSFRFRFASAARSREPFVPTGPLAIGLQVRVPGEKTQTFVFPFEIAVMRWVCIMIRMYIHIGCLSLRRATDAVV
jgi:hypothetical protein